MKKQSATNYPVPVSSIPLLIVPAATSSHAKKEKKVPKVTPPDEEKITRLNNLAKESPFCFYYKERNKDFM